MSDKPVLAVIGGSGLYAIQGLEDVQEVNIDTPFGKPSAPVVTGRLEGKPVAFLARHGIGHTILPQEVNSRANIWALKSLGAERVISISAVGSLREDYKPGEIVVPDQLIDFTKDRQRTFFGDGLVAHIGSADPFCSELSGQLLTALETTGVTIHSGGSLVTIEGPRFSTRAESQVFRSWGASLIGMTACPEAFLAREAELCFAVMAHVTDYDVWHVSEEPVTVEMVLSILESNTRSAQEALHALLRKLPEGRSCDCSAALQNAIISQAERIPPATRKNLALLVDKYLK
ncbi:MAG: S-methyl-5'-thioadenosine phosphorylase [Anaerolineaceae bacterium]|nr:S-methyl-5'-thioadenosine phosphorylase [Anaerolineaceae bacterium]